MLSLLSERPFYDLNPIWANFRECAIFNIFGSGVGDDEEEQEGPKGVFPEAGEGRVRRKQRQAQGAKAARQEDQRPGTIFRVLS